MGGTPIQPKVMSEVKQAARDAVHGQTAEARAVTPQEREAVVNAFRTAMGSPEGRAAVDSAMQNMDKWFGSYASHGVDRTADVRSLIQDAYARARNG